MKMKGYSPKLVVLALSVILASGISLFFEGSGCDALAAPSADCARVRVCERVYNCWRETQCQNIYRCENRYSCWKEYSCQRWYSCRNERVCGWERNYVCSGWGWWRSCGYEWSYSCSNQRVCGWEEWCGSDYVCGWSRDCGWVRDCAPRTVCAWQESCEIYLQCDPDPEIPPTLEVIGYTPYPGSPDPTAKPTARPTSEPEDDDPGDNSAPQPTSPPATSVPPTATSVPPTPSPVPALNADLDADYSSLVLYASKIGEPPQGMSGEVSGGDGGTYTVILHVRNPEGSESTYNLTTDGTFDFDSGDAGDPDFGTTEEGIWSAWIEASDSVGTTATSASVTWEVGWYPSHETP